MATRRTFIGTRVGALTVTVCIILESLAVCVWFLVRYVLPNRINRTMEFKGVAYAGFAVYGGLIVSSGLLLCGIFMTCKRLFHPWMVVIVMVLLFDTGAVSLVTALHADAYQGLNGLDIAGIVFYAVRMAGNIFSFVTVQSFYSKIESSKNSTKNDGFPPLLSGAASQRQLAADTQQAPSPNHIIQTLGQSVAAPIADP